jgi:hypothetical protein
VLRTLRHVARQVAPAAVLVLAVPACGTSSPPPPGASSSSSGQHSSTREAPPAPSEGITAVTIRLTIDGHPVEATLNAGATARDFVTFLPLTLDMADFHQTERIAYPPRDLDISGAPDAATPKAGDLAYYVPWGNLALFYRDGQHSPGLVILGRLNHDEDTERLANADRVTIETVS